MIIECGLDPIGVRELTQGRQPVTYLVSHIPGVRLIIALAVIPLMGLTAFFTGHSDETVSLVWLFAFSLIAASWKQQWLLQGLEMMGSIAGAQAIRSVVFTVGVILLVHSSKDLLLVGVIEITAAIVLAAYYLAMQHIRVTPIRFHFAPLEFRRLAGEGLSVGLAHMIWAFHLYIPVVLVGIFAGGSETAWFGAAHRLVLSLLAFSWVYHFNLFPAIARRVNQSKDPLNLLLGASIRVVAWVGVFFTFAIALISRPLLATLFGEPFASAASAFSILVWIIPVTTIAGHARWSLVAAGKQRYVVVAQSAGAVTMVIVGLIMIPLYEGVGAAIAMLAANLMVWGVSQAFATHCVSRIPIVALTARPFLLALIFGTLSILQGHFTWISACALTAGFVLCAPILDPKLYFDFLHLIRAKTELESVSKAST